MKHVYKIQCDTQTKGFLEPCGTTTFMVSTNTQRFWEIESACRNWAEKRSETILRILLIEYIGEVSEASDESS